jgi:hypothetical protein
VSFKPAGNGRPRLRLSLLQNSGTRIQDFFPGALNNATSNDPGILSPANADHVAMTNSFAKRELHTDDQAAIPLALRCQLSSCSYCRKICMV